MHAVNGGGGRFHVAFYMLSTLGGTVDQSTAAGKAGNRLPKKKFVFRIKSFFLLKTLFGFKGYISSHIGG